MEDTRALRAIAIMQAMVLATTAIRSEPRPPGCNVCGDPTGIRCCEFGAAR